MLAALWEMFGYDVIKFINHEDSLPNWATKSSAELNKLMRSVDEGKIDVNVRKFRNACRKVKSIALSELE